MAESRRNIQRQSEGILKKTFDSNVREISSIPRRLKKNIHAQRGKLDIGFLVILGLIIIFGLIMQFSASGPKGVQEYNDRYFFIRNQLIFVGVGILIMLAMSLVPTDVWRIIVKPLMFIVLILLIYTKLVGEKGRWIRLFGINFQPSELAKFTLIVYISNIISIDPDCVKKVDKFIGKIVLPLGIFEMLVAIEPHLSATILIFLICITIIFVGGLDKKILIPCLIGAVVIVFLLILFGRSYWGERIDIWLDPYSDPTGSSYQTLQSMRAIGSGGLFGVGLGESTQKYLWLPEPQNDFIFSVVCEELGLVGGVFVLALFSTLVLRGFILASRSRSRYNALLIVGIVSQIGYQAFLNAAVATNAMPNTGISLPFFSYGGTSIMMLLAQVGVLLSASRASKVKKV